MYSAGRFPAERHMLFDEAEEAQQTARGARDLMDLHIHVPWILQVAEAAGVNDPAPDGYGVPVSAVVRHRAESSEQPGHDGPCAKAAQPVGLTEQPVEAQAAAPLLETVDAPLNGIALLVCLRVEAGWTTSPQAVPDLARGLRDDGPDASAARMPADWTAAKICCQVQSAAHPISRLRAVWNAPSS